MVFSMVMGCGGSGNADSGVNETKKPSGQETTADAGLSWKDQYDLGIRLLNEGRYEEAILAFTAAIRINPKSAKTYVSRAGAYLAWVDAAVQDAYASVGEGETLVWSDIIVSTSEGDKTVADLYQNAADDFAKAEDLIANGESTDELDEKEAQDVADKLDQVLEDLEQSMQPAQARLPLGYRMEYENPEDGIPTGWTKFYYDENGVKIGTAYVEADGTEYGMSTVMYDVNGQELPWLGSDAIYTYDGDGYLTQIASGDYYRYVYIYDSEHHLVQREFYNAFGLDDMTYYLYDSQGHLIQKQSIAYYSSGNRTPNYINYKYDDAGRLIYQETLDGNGIPYIWTSYTYNSVGELISEYHWYEPNPEFGGPYTYYYIYE